MRFCDVVTGFQYGSPPLSGGGSKRTQLYLHSFPPNSFVPGNCTISFNIAQINYQISPAQEGYVNYLKNNLSVTLNLYRNHARDVFMKNNFPLAKVRPYQAG